MKMSQYFSEGEFNRCSPPCSMNDMDEALLDVMDDIRRKAGIPLLMSSAYRSSEWDRMKGRSGDGAHTYGLAVDFVCNNSVTRSKILKACHECGVTRIGVSDSFIHVDIAGGRKLESHVKKGSIVTFPDNVTWTY